MASFHTMPTEIQTKILSLALKPPQAYICPINIDNYVHDVFLDPARDACALAIEQYKKHAHAILLACPAVLEIADKIICDYSDHYKQVAQEALDAITSFSTALATPFSTAANATPTYQINKVLKLQASRSSNSTIDRALRQLSLQIHHFANRLASARTRRAVGYKWIKGKEYWCGSWIRGEHGSARAGENGVVYEVSLKTRELSRTGIIDIGNCLVFHPSWAGPKEGWAAFREGKRFG